MFWRRKERSPAAVIPILILVIIVIFAVAYYVGYYGLQRTCQTEYNENEFSILSKLNPVKEQTGTEYARTLYVTFTSYRGDVKTPENIHEVYCSAYVMLCKKDNGDIQYCQDYVVPFSAEV